MTGESNSRSSVIEEVVARDLCVGCGVCCLQWPDLHMVLGRYGQYLPQGPMEGEAQDAAAAGTLSVCPFSNVSCDEDSIALGLFGSYPGVQHTNGVGYHLGAWAGGIVDKDRRMESASGGCLSWIGETLLRQGDVDAVISVAPSQDGNALFEYRIFRDASEFLQARKSRYYPVELSGVLRAIKETEGSYAITALPCMSKAIRLAMCHDATLKARVKFVLGLVCGHLKTRQYAEYLSRCCGVHEEEIVSVDFRHKMSGKAANAYAFEVEYEDNGVGQRRTIPMAHVFGGSWGYNLFMLRCCDYCDDLFAETADVAVGDAWLPEYVANPEGTNVIIARHPRIQALIEDGVRAGRLDLDGLPMERVLASQAGGLRHRRNGLGYRLHLLESRGLFTPKKRIEPSRKSVPWVFRRMLELRMALRETSKEAFEEQKLKGRGTAHFQKRIRKLIGRYRWLQRLRNPRKHIRALFRRLF